NKYFSNDSIDLDIDVSDDTEEISDDDVETIKGATDDWIEQNIDNNTSLNSDIFEESTDSIEKQTLEEEKTSINDDLNDTINDKIEAELMTNVDTSAIEKEIEESTLEDLKLNFDYDNIKVNNDINEEKLEEGKNDSTEQIKVVEDTQYKKLSGDELINLLNKTANGEDFFKEVEVIND
ncbi:MAG: hypothetical protein IJ715_04315, partial [Bacilli bacterium]|nr:hypothetical protein [Bacilli bacterium]